MSAFFFIFSHHRRLLQSVSESCCGLSITILLHAVCPSDAIQTTSPSHNERSTGTNSVTRLLIRDQFTVNLHATSAITRFAAGRRDYTQRTTVMEIISYQNEKKIKLWRQSAVSLLQTKRLVCSWIRISSYYTTTTATTTTSSSSSSSSSKPTAYCSKSRDSVDVL